MAWFFWVWLLLSAPWYFWIYQSLIEELRSRPHTRVEYFVTAYFEGPIFAVVIGISWPVLAFAIFINVFAHLLNVLNDKRKKRASK